MAFARGISQNKKTLIFVEKKETADVVVSFLESNGISAKAIHSDKEQRERENAINDFKYGRCLILVATGVAARGLDIKDVDHVINYDLPSGGIDEYIHRIGRTGRIGNNGRATSFYDPGTDKNIAVDLVKALSEAQQDVPEWLSEGAAAVERRSGHPNTDGPDRKSPNTNGNAINESGDA